MANSMITYQEAEQYGHAMVASGFFSDIKKVSQAIVKIQAGAEMGLPPFASMTGIHIIQGKPVLGASLMATLVENDQRYGYKVVTATGELCEIAFYSNDEKVGTASFSIDEAKAAGLLSKDNWKKYPSDMLFARAMSRGARRYAAGIFGGSPVYVFGELEDDTQVVTEGAVAEVAVVVEGAVVEPEPEPEMTPEQEQEYEKKEYEKNTRQFHALGTNLYGAEWDEKRHELVKAITKGRTDSSTELTAAELAKLTSGMADKLMSKNAEESD